jgi:hypothetical protein
MKRYLLSAVLMLAVTPALASEYVQTTVRIETADYTIYSGDVYISDTGCTVRDTDGVKHTVDGASAVCALKEAATLGGFDYDLQDSSYGLYLTGVDGQSATSADYWSFFLNYTSATVGLADYELENGDTVILSLGGYPNSALELKVPSQEIRSGEKLVVRVKADGAAVVGATVYFNNQTDVTDSLGKASFRPRNNGNLVVYAEADGYTRTTSETVRVVEKHQQNSKVDTTEQQAMMSAAQTYLIGEVSDGMLDDSQSVTDWAVISLAAAGFDTSALSAAALEYDPTADDDYAAGELSRHILVLAALGQDATDYNGVDYVARLIETMSDGQFGDEAYVNDDIYAGLALLAAGVSADDANVQAAVSAAKDSINTDGGVSYAVAQDASDVDTTAALVQLLAATSNTGSAFKGAVHYLVDQQNLDGGWGYDDHGVSNASSTSLAIHALNAAGRKINTVRSNHRSGYNFLVSVQKPNGRFVYDTNGSYSYETLNSAYAMMALAHQALPVVY